MEDKNSVSENPMENIKREVAELIRQNSSLAFEFNEYKNKTEQDTKKMLISFIEIADAYENIFKRIDSKLDCVDPLTKNWVNNFRTVYKMLIRALRVWNVIPIDVVIGEKVNPYWHSVEEVVRMQNRENETIVEEVRKGYLWNGRLLRAAEVKAVYNK